MIAPISPAKTMLRVIALGSTTPFAIVVATASERKAPATLRTAESATATRGGSAPGRDGGGHGVGRVVEPVGEIERERGSHDYHEQKVASHASMVSGLAPSVWVFRRG